MRVVGGTNRASVESSYRTRKRERERRREKPLVFSSVEVLTRSTKSVDGAVEDELGSVDARFGGTTSLRHPIRGRTWRWVGLRLTTHPDTHAALAVLAVLAGTDTPCSARRGCR